MIQSIQFRKVSFLLEPEWKELPWEYNMKDFSQTLYDYGFELGALQSQMDDAGLQRGELTPRDARFFLGSLKKFQAQIDAWYQGYLSVSPSPLYWVSDESYNLLPEEQQAGIGPLPGPFTFPTLRHATVSTTYWALNIAVLGSFRQLFHEMTRSSTSPEAPPPPPGTSGESLPTQLPLPPEEQRAQNPSFPTQPEAPSNSKTTLPLRNSASTHPSASPYPPTTPNPITLATNIVRTMPFSLSPTQGLLGAQQSLFALRVALFILRLHPGPELRWCQSIYSIMHQRKGLRYATEIAKVDGGHGTRGNERLKGGTPARTPEPVELRDEVGPYTVGGGESG